MNTGTKNKLNKVKRHMEPILFTKEKDQIFFVPLLVNIYTYTFCVNKINGIMFPNLFISY